MNFSSLEMQRMLSEEEMAMKLVEQGSGLSFQNKEEILVVEDSGVDVGEGDLADVAGGEELDHLEGQTTECLYQGCPSLVAGRTLKIICERLVM